MKKILILTCILALTSIAQASQTICEAGGMAKGNGYETLSLVLSKPTQVEFQVVQHGKKIIGTLPLTFEKMLDETTTAKLYLGKVKIPGQLFKEKIPLVLYFRNEVPVFAKVSIENISDSGRRLPTSPDDYLRNLMADFSCK